MKKFFFPMMLIILLLSGCGEQSNGSAEDTKIVIGIDDEFAPLSFHNERNELVGFDIDLAKETAKRMGVKVEFKPIDWDKKREEITSGNIDMIWNGLDIIDERKEYMIFTKPYMDDRQIFLVRKNSEHGIHSEIDLEGKVVGLQAGSTAENYLEQNETLRNTFAELKTYAKFNTGLEDLNNGAIDVFICDELIARYEIKTKPARFEIVDTRTGFVTEMGIGFPKEKVQLRDKVQKTFDEMVADGTAKKISEEWFQADLIKEF